MRPDPFVHSDINKIKYAALIGRADAKTKIGDIKGAKDDYRLAKIQEDLSKAQFDEWKNKFDDNS